MPKKLKWPLAKVREDGMPAIWLNHTNWLVLRDGIVHCYLRGRERQGKSDARKKAGKPDEILDHYASAYFQKSEIEAALEMYQVGYKAHPHNEDRRDLLTPVQLVAAGDKWYQRGFDETLKHLAREAKEILQAA